MKSHKASVGWQRGNVLCIILQWQCCLSGLWRCQIDNCQHYSSRQQRYAFTRPLTVIQIGLVADIRHHMTSRILCWRHHLPQHMCTDTMRYCRHTSIVLPYHLGCTLHLHTEKTKTRPSPPSRTVHRPMCRVKQKSRRLLKDGRLADWARRGPALLPQPRLQTLLVVRVEAWQG